jgi:hypothetical protein
MQKNIVSGSTVPGQVIGEVVDHSMVAVRQVNLTGSTGIIGEVVDHSMVAVRQGVTGAVVGDHSMVAVRQVDDCTGEFMNVDRELGTPVIHTVARQLEYPGGDPGRLVFCPITPERLELEPLATVLYQVDPDRVLLKNYGTVDFNQLLEERIRRVTQDMAQRFATEIRSKVTVENQTVMELVQVQDQVINQLKEYTDANDKALWEAVTTLVVAPLTQYLNQLMNGLDTENQVMHKVVTDLAILRKTVNDLTGSYLGQLTGRINELLENFA